MKKCLKIIAITVSAAAAVGGVIVLLYYLFGKDKHVEIDC